MLKYQSLCSFDIKITYVQCHNQTNSSTHNQNKRHRTVVLNCAFMFIAPGLSPCDLTSAFDASHNASYDASETAEDGRRRQVFRSNREPSQLYLSLALLLTGFVFLCPHCLNKEQINI